MIEILLNITQQIFNEIEKKREIHEVTSLRISQVLDEIATILSNTAENFQNDEYPHGNCVIMKRLSENLGFHISEYVSSEEFERLMSSLKNVSQLERLYAQRKDSNIISELQRAAGEFKSMSILMKF